MSDPTALEILLKHSQEQSVKLDKILEQTSKTNGRVNTLESKFEAHDNLIKELIEKSHDPKNCPTKIDVKWITKFFWIGIGIVPAVISSFTVILIRWLFSLP